MIDWIGLTKALFNFLTLEKIKKSAKSTFKLTYTTVEILVETRNTNILSNEKEIVQIQTKIGQFCPN